MIRAVVPQRRTALVGAAALAAWAAAACAGARARPAAAATPVEVTRAFYQALHAGDAAGAARLVDGPHAAEAAAAFVTLARAYQELEQALVAKFGPDAAHAVGYADRVAAEDRAVASARAEVEGDRATVLHEDHPLATLHRVDGAWRVVLEEDLSTEQGVAALTEEARASAAAAERVTPAIRGGLFDDPENAVEAFQSELEVGRGGAAPAGPARPEAAPRGPSGAKAGPDAGR